MQGGHKTQCTDSAAQSKPRPDVGQTARPSRCGANAIKPRSGARPARSPYPGEAQRNSFLAERSRVSPSRPPVADPVVPAEPAELVLDSELPLAPGSVPGRELPLAPVRPRAGARRPPRHLADLPLAERRAAVAGLGEPPFRAVQLSRHFFGRFTDSPAEMS